MGGVLVANPRIAFEGLEEGIQVWGGEDQNPVWGENPAQLGDRKFWVTEVFHDMFDDDRPKDLITRIKTGDFITEQYLNYAIGMVKEAGHGPADQISTEALLTNSLKKEIKPKTVGQSEYVDAVDKNDIDGSSATAEDNVRFTVSYSVDFEL